MEYKHPTGAYPLRDIHKICRFCTALQGALTIKISLDLLKGLRSYGGLEVLYHRAKFGGARISPAAGVAKNVEFFFVCLFVRHAFVVWFPRRSLGGASVRLPFISFNNRST